VSHQREPSERSGHGELTLLTSGPIIVAPPTVGRNRGARPSAGGTTLPQELGRAEHGMVDHHRWWRISWPPGPAGWVSVPPTPRGSELSPDLRAPVRGGGEWTRGRAPTVPARGTTGKTMGAGTAPGVSRDSGSRRSRRRRGGPGRRLAPVRP